MFSGLWSRQRVYWSVCGISLDVSCMPYRQMADWPPTYMAEYGKITTFQEKRHYYLINTLYLRKPVLLNTVPLSIGFLNLVSYPGSPNVEPGNVADCGLLVVDQGQSWWKDTDCLQVNRKNQRTRPKRLAIEMLYVFRQSMYISTKHKCLFKCSHIMHPPPRHLPLPLSAPPPLPSLTFLMCRNGIKRVVEAGGFLIM